MTIDSNDRLWLFGGAGAASVIYYTNDLWMFEITSIHPYGNWTFVAGMDSNGR
jgi:hypothetical protein